MTPAEGVKRAAQALSLLWPFAVIAAVSFGRMSLLLAFAASLFGTPVAEAVARKLSKEPLPDAGIRYCRKVTVAWCIFFIANGGVAAATVLSGNRAAWLLWNGCLSYGAIGLMMGIEYLVRRRVMRHAA